MTTLTEGHLTFVFDEDAQAVQYDTWSFYRNQYQKSVGGKAVDFLCIHRGTSFLIEVKDYRHHPRTKPLDLVDEVVQKVRDTAAALVGASANANDVAERAIARSALNSGQWRVVLHLEQPSTRSRLRPQVVDAANLSLKLKQRLKALDPHPRVMDRGSTPVNHCWSVE